MTVILRKAFGGAFITMNSKDLGADYVFAWPEAEIGVMGARPAVGVIHRRELAAADDPEAERDRLAAEYAEQQLRAAGGGAARGYVDELIAPAETRAAAGLGVRLAGGAAMSTASGRGPAHRDDRLRRHGAAGALPGAQRPRRWSTLVRAEPTTRRRRPDRRGAGRTCSASRAAEHAGRVQAVAADLTAPGLGLDPADARARSPSA